MRPTIVLAALGIGAAVVGTSVALPAAADPSNNCQTNGGVTVCAQGGPNNGAGQSAPGIVAPNRSGQQGCTNSFGAYQNCNTH
jgi:glycine/D-amino acid oxidase-like deaminating enzyme